jgi:hypothetical protein
VKAHRSLTNSSFSSSSCFKRSLFDLETSSCALTFWLLMMEAAERRDCQRM